MRIIVALLAVAALCGCGGAPELATVGSASGCVGIAVDRPVDLPGVLAVSARECHHTGAHDELLDRRSALDVLTATAWRTPGPRFEVLHVTVYRTAEDATTVRPQSEHQTRQVLVQRWGPRDATLDRAGPGSVSRDTVWSVMAVTVALGAVLLGRAVVRAVRAGAVVAVLIPFR